MFPLLTDSLPASLNWSDCRFPRFSIDPPAGEIGICPPASLRDMNCCAFQSLGGLCMFRCTENLGVKWPTLLKAWKLSSSGKADFHKETRSPLYGTGCTIPNPTWKTPGLPFSLPRKLPNASVLLCWDIHNLGGDVDIAAVLVVITVFLGRIHPREFKRPYSSESVLLCWGEMLP